MRGGGNRGFRNGKSEQKEITYLSSSRKLVTDDVSKRVREHRKILKSRHLPEILSRPNVKVAFIPYLVPARIQYKIDNTWKFFFLPDDQ